MSYVIDNDGNITFKYPLYREDSKKAPYTAPSKYWGTPLNYGTMCMEFSATCEDVEKGGWKKIAEDIFPEWFNDMLDLSKGLEKSVKKDIQDTQKKCKKKEEE